MIVELPAEAALDHHIDDDVWISDLARPTLVPLTNDPAFEGSPLWTINGEQLVFGSDRDGPRYHNRPWRKTVDGPDEAERLGPVEDSSRAQVT